MSDYSRLRELAEAATPGPWTHCPSACSNPYSGKLYDHTVYYVEPGAFSPGTRIAHTNTIGSWAHSNKTAQANARFIAAASPDVVLALLADLAAANRRAEEAEDLDRLNALVTADALRDAQAARAEAKALREVLIPVVKETSLGLLGYTETKQHYCLFCEQIVNPGSGNDDEHSEECLVVRARTALRAASAEGEGEDRG